MDVICVIATKNRLNWLKRAINSVLNQTEKVDYFFVVSDSTDENFYVEKEFLCDKNCVLLRNKYSKNYAGNLNTAIDHIISSNIKIQNTFIALLDDDDFWDKNYIFECKKVCEGLDFVVCGIRCNNENFTYDLDIPSKLSVDDFLKGNPGIQGSNTFIKFSTLLRAGCFDEQLSSTTDRDLFVRVMKLLPTYKIINKYLVYADTSNKRTRITNTSNIKKDGLAKFYNKYLDIMTDEDEESFLNRCENVFDLNTDELFKRIDKLNVLNAQESTSLKEKEFLHPELFSCTEDFKYLLKNFYKCSHHSKEYAKLVDYCLSSFFEKQGVALKSVALFCIESLVKNMKYTRVQLYEKYLEILKFIHIKNFRLQCMKHTNEIEPFFIDNDEIEIKASIDYIRHQITSHNTLISFNYHKDSIKKYLYISKYRVLGYGSEGLVFECGGYVYKWFKKWDLKLVEHLSYIKKHITNCKSIYDFDIVNNDYFLFIKYPYVKATKLEYACFNDLLNIIEDFKYCGLCLTNIKKRNFVIDDRGIKYIDYGYSIAPFNNLDYEKSKSRAKQLVDNFKKSELIFYKIINESYLRKESN